ncbi:uncharacterized protein LOC112350556 [Selaginella moellendorffii]|uniref:uncharacterized protein LOC112350556 n=1 Tax=Selaginella moellendorffii TaxID=88036 RepID=UPI000D1CBBDB|nr:uncharacterized protein LOC112350556 [Selaginella moellendorffii]|eukprot:XP_024542693.1 uncharacterized protein LOC112350556 [Selaginella moellendorffii]
MACSCLGVVALPGTLRWNSISHLPIRAPRVPCALASSSSLISDRDANLKRGTVGEERFKESAVPGTYYWSGASDKSAEKVEVRFNTGSGDNVTVTANSGENLLKVAERCGVLVPNDDFCFEGTCCHCELDVVGGAQEAGYRAEANRGNLVRSCICPVPSGRSTVEVNVISDEEVWGDSVV